MIAVEEDDMETISCLAFKGADVNEKNDIGDTPLIFASANGNLEIVKYLVAKGSNRNFRLGSHHLDSQKYVRKM